MKTREILKLIENVFVEIMREKLSSADKKKKKIDRERETLSIKFKKTKIPIHFIDTICLLNELLFNPCKTLLSDGTKKKKCTTDLLPHFFTLNIH